MEEKSAEWRIKYSRCQKCGKKSRYLALHHLWYDFGRLPWDYPDEAFEVLCPPCHRMADEDREEQELDAKNERLYGWQGELARNYRQPRGTNGRRFEDNKTEFEAWLIRKKIPGRSWNREIYPVWYFWNLFSEEFFADLRDDEPQALLPF